MRLACLVLFAACGDDVREVRFEKRVLDERFLAEGVAVFDVDNDGRNDIVSADQWFVAPAFEPRAIGTVTPLDPATQYSEAFVNYPMDVDRDGAIDLVTFGFPLFAATWKRNVGDAIWPEYPLAGGSFQESPRVGTLGGTDFAIFHADGMHVGLYSPTGDLNAPWTPRLLDAPVALPGHGLGIGDIDGDGRDDVITPSGFWSMPAAIADPWPFTTVELGPDCAQMHVIDVNGDRLPDVITSSAHAVGLWWHEQQADGTFVRHTISEAFSQSHALEVADVNGDGRLDIVTGKRMWAHGPAGDIDPDAPKVLYWFEQTRDAAFVPHLIDDDSGVGTQFVVTDVNGDSRVDIVTSNKRGTFYFEQR